MRLSGCQCKEEKSKNVIGSAAVKEVFWGSGHIIAISFHEIGSYSVGIRSRRGSPRQSAVLQQSGGEDDPSHTCRGVR